MGQVSVFLNGRTYHLACAEGDEARLRVLLAYVKDRMERLVIELGPVDEARLLLMSAVVLADELIEARGYGKGQGEAASVTPIAPAHRGIRGAA
jgi:cell division protein ZapA